jgi:N-methylhydantoinase B
MATDPVTQEIIEGKLIATVDEMGIVMAKTSMSPVIYEVLDFACGILTPEGDLVAQMNGITLFTGTFGAQVKSLLRQFDGRIEPGDILLTNDPYAGGTHACDFAIVRPVFIYGSLTAIAINVAHYLDVGGAVPGSVPPNATSVFQEGLRLPGVKIARGERLNDELIHIIRENVRLPDIAMGDLNAQIATVRIAEARIVEMVAKYGAATLSAAFHHILDSSERLARAAILALPDGDYTAHDVIDGDGVTDAAIVLTVTLRVRGNRLEADFTGCPPATDGPINCARGALQSAVKTVFKALVAPQAPSNDGWFRPLTVMAPDDTIFTARKPKPTGWYYEGSVHASELVWQALAALRPDRFSAGSYASLCATYISGTGMDGLPFIHVEPQHGGWGATAEWDGTAGLIALTDGDTYNYSVEVIEAKFPLRVTRYGLNTEGGVGAGEYRGGYGLVREYAVLAPGCVVHASFGRTRTLPWGMAGGGPGSANAMERVLPDGRIESRGRFTGLQLDPGDRVRLVTGGGGGWGDPARREPAAIQRDLRDGVLTAERAAREYPQALTGDRP